MTALRIVQNKAHVMSSQLHYVCWGRTMYLLHIKKLNLSRSILISLNRVTTFDSLPKNIVKDGLSFLYQGINDSSCGGKPFGSNRSVISRSAYRSGIVSRSLPSKILTCLISIEIGKATKITKIVIILILSSLLQ